VLFEDYLKRLDEETRKDEHNEKLIDRNSRLAADLHAVMLLAYRSTRQDEYTPQVARGIVGSFVFLTTRHTWNKCTREEGARGRRARRSQGADGERAQAGCW
jgi:hypothetical protein